jgi:ABC-type oligopeptide transport system substrate-binding subunit
MKNMLSIVSPLLLGLALTLTACGKDKKPAATEPAKTEPTATEPAKTDPAAAAPKADDKKADEKPASGGGW